MNIATQLKLSIVSALFLSASNSLAVECTIFGNNGKSALAIAGAQSTQYSSNISETIATIVAYLNASPQSCQYSKKTCGIVGNNGKSAVIIDGSQSTPYSSDINIAIKDIDALAKAGLCTKTWTQCQIYGNNGKTAVTIGGVQATGYADVSTSSAQLRALSTSNNCQNYPANGAPAVQAPSPSQSHTASNTSVSAPQPLPKAGGSIQVGGCWKGYSYGEQNANMKTCKQIIKSGQACEANAHVHKGGVYDVCIREITGTLKVIFCLPGLNQKMQNDNQKNCETQVKGNPGQMCVTSMGTHGRGAYDVCAMGEAID